METLLDFLRMGGHGVFIWPSYFLAFLVLLANGWAARQRRRRALQQIIIAQQESTNGDVTIAQPVASAVHTHAKTSEKKT